MPDLADLKLAEVKEIIKVTPEQINAGFDQINHHDVDTLLHVGGALGIVAMIVATVVWMALLAFGNVRQRAGEIGILIT